MISVRKCMARPIRKFRTTARRLATSRLSRAPGNAGAARRATSAARAGTEGFRWRHPDQPQARLEPKLYFARALIPRPMRCVSSTRSRAVSQLTALFAGGVISGLVGVVVATVTQFLVRRTE